VFSGISQIQFGQIKNVTFTQNYKNFPECSVDGCSGCEIFQDNGTSSRQSSFVVQVEKRQVKSFVPELKKFYS